MGCRNTAEIPILLLLLICCCTLFSAGNKEGKNHPPEASGVEPDDQQAVVSPPTTILDTAKSLFSPLSTTRLAVLQEAASNSWTWIKIKIKTMMLFFNQPQDFPSSAPSLDFRRQANDPEEPSADADAATEKVKEAVFKSLDQGTVMIENSARSASKLARDAMDTTANKLQKTLGKQSEAEL